MYITNIWRIFFSFIIPTIMLGIGLYYAGIEKEKKVILRTIKILMEEQ